MPIKERFATAISETYFCLRTLTDSDRLTIQLKNEFNTLPPRSLALRMRNFRNTYQHASQQLKGAVRADFLLGSTYFISKTVGADLLSIGILAGLISAFAITARLLILQDNSHFRIEVAEDFLRNPRNR